MDPRMVSTDFIVATGSKIQDEYPGLRIGFTFGNRSTDVQFRFHKNTIGHRMFTSSDSSAGAIARMYSIVNQIAGELTVKTEGAAEAETARRRHITFLVALAKKLELEFSDLRIRVELTDGFAEDSVYVTVANEHRVRGAAVPPRASAAESLRTILDLAIHVS